MCKGCKNVFPSQNLDKNKLCKECREDESVMEKIKKETMSICEGCDNVIPFQDLDRDGLCKKCREDESIVEKIHNIPTKMIFLEKNGQTIAVPRGFSWTTFFFGFFVPLLRKDWKGFIIILLLSIFTGIGRFIMETQGEIGEIGGIALVLIVGVLSGMFYNKFYTKNLIRVGYKAKNGSSQRALDKLFN